MNSLISIKNNDVISIVGSGGKTSLLYNISKSIYKKKILVSTTTKIKVPPDSFYDYIALNEKDFNALRYNSSKGIYVFANKIENNKLESLDLDYLKNLITDFEITILEADGAKEKLLKGWNDNEPVILDNTTKTIGVINLDTIGICINAMNVHRLDKFLAITGCLEGDIVNVDCLVNIISSENGLFKNALGERILFINGLEEEGKEVVAREVARKLREKHFKLDYIVAGSILRGVFLII